MNNHILKEDTPVGSIVYTLKGHDPENSSVRYGILGTDVLTVDPISGEVKLVKPLDREVSTALWKKKKRFYFYSVEKAKIAEGKKNVKKVGAGLGFVRQRFQTEFVAVINNLFFFFNCNLFLLLSFQRYVADNCNFLSF